MRITGPKTSLTAAAAGRGKFLGWLILFSLALSPTAAAAAQVQASAPKGPQKSDVKARIKRVENNLLPEFIIKGTTAAAGGAVVPGIR